VNAAFAVTILDLISRVHLASFVTDINKKINNIDFKLRKLKGMSMQDEVTI
jgi:hypothetical protein